jgi:hypothetical protein
MSKTSIIETPKDSPHFYVFPEGLLRLSHLTEGSPPVSETDSTSRTDCNYYYDSEKPGRRHSDDSFDQLKLLIDRNRQMHRLAGAHCRSKYRILLFLPSVIITAVSGLLAFLIATIDKGATNEEAREERLAILVGCL